MRSPRLLRLAPLAFLALAACAPPGDAPDPAPDPIERVIPVSVAEARESTVIDPVIVTGVIRPLREVVVAAEGAGRVVDLPARLGLTVQRGEALAVLDSEVARNQLDQARAQASQVDAGLELAQGELRRAEELAAEGAFTTRDLEAARIQVRSVEAQSAMAAAAVRLAERALRDTTIRAPFGGTISFVQLELGALVGPGTPAVGLVDLSAARIGVGVAGREVPSLEAGQRAIVRIPSLQERAFAGTVTAIAPSSDARTRTWPVEVTVANPSGELRGGMVARVEIVVGERLGVLVPDGALVEGDTARVFVIVDGQAQERRVELGRGGAGTLELRSGVHAGEAVAVLGSQHLSDGVRVSVYAMPDREQPPLAAPTE